MAKFIPGGPPRYEHQKRGLKKMIETLGVCALLYEPGTGKTATTLDFASVLALKSPDWGTGKEARVLVVAPLAAIDTWVIQAAEYVSPQVNYWAEALGGSIEQKAYALAARGGDPMKMRNPPKRPQKVARRAFNTRKAIAWGARSGDAEGTVRQAEGPDGLGAGRPRLIIEVVNIDAFGHRHAYGSKTIADLMLEAVKRYSPDLVVIDESHKIKSHSSNVSRLMARIQPYARRRILLTGTVMPKGPMDVFGQWRFLEPHAFGTVKPDGSRRPATFGQFRDRYAQMGGYMGREVVGYHRLDEMESIMAKNSIVAKKEDALDLPPFSDVEVKVHLSPAESKAYKSMKDDLAIRLDPGETASAPNRLAQMMRLRQITSGHLPLDDGTVKEVGDSKASAISSIVHDNLAGEKRIVIFVLFKHEVQLLERKLKRKGTEVVTIAGGTPSEARIGIRKRFGSNDPARIVLVAQIKTLSLAVNELVTASHAIFGSMSQQRDDYIQARDRLNRIGQKRPVTFWHATVPGTVDGVILQAHRDRTDLETSVLKHIMEDNAPG